MRRYKMVCSILFIMAIVFLFSGCAKKEICRGTASIITIRYISKTGYYIVALEGRKTVKVYQTGAKITIRPGTKPTLSFLLNRYGNIRYPTDYEFIFSDYEQVREYLQMEQPGKDAQAYAYAESSSSCFISALN